MTFDEITKKMIALGLGVPDNSGSGFAERQSELDRFCQAVSGDGLVPATGIGAQFNPQPEITVAEMARRVGCTEEEMITYLEVNA
jgi:hypothetical protein